MTPMFSFLLAVLPLLAVVCGAGAVPLLGYGAAAGVSSPVAISPLAAALTLLPLPLLVAAKYVYVRFRRGQSIHAHPHTCSPVFSSSASASEQRSRSGFWLGITPYLVGFFGSPEWETKIRSRLDKTLRQAKHDSCRSSHNLSRSPIYSPALGGSIRTTGNTSTAYYSSLSYKSRSRSKSLSASFGDNSGDRLPSPRVTTHVFPAITDCSAIHPCSPPCQHAALLPVPPPPALTTQTPVRGSAQDNSPTLMQIMEPVLAAWYDDTKGLRPLPTESSHSSANTSRNKSGSSVESTSLTYQTPLTSPASPAMPGAFSASSMSFTLLRKQLGVFTTSSALSLGATTLPSPNSASLAVFHSPTAPSIPVPKPVYSPDIRPESCSVLPVYWQSDRERLSVHSILQSPTHRSPVPGRSSGIFDMLGSGVAAKSPKVSFSPVLAPPISPALLRSGAAGPVVLKSALKKASGAHMSPALPSSLRNSVSFSLASVTAGDSSATALLSPSDSAKGKDRASWDLSDLLRNGQLDVDAVLGLGLGMGLSLAPGSRGSVGSIGSATSLAALLSENVSETGEEYDVEQYAVGWGSPQPGDRASMQLRWYMPGRQLCAIPEETRSDVCSIAGSVHRAPERVGEGQDESASGVVSMEPDSAAEDGRTPRASIVEKRMSHDVKRESWREGESVVTWSVGIAW